MDALEEEEGEVAKQVAELQRWCLEQQPHQRLLQHHQQLLQTVVQEITVIASHPRGRLFLWLAGAVPHLHTALALTLQQSSQEQQPCHHQHAGTSCTTLTSSSNIAASSTVAVRATILAVLTCLCSERACAAQLASVGGHQTLLTIINSSPQPSHDATDEPPDDVLAAHDCEAQIRCSGCPFPMTPTTAAAAAAEASASAAPSRYRLPSPTTTSPHSTCTGTTVAAAAPPLTILVRGVARRQESQFDVGFVMWPAAVALARWLHAHAAAELHGRSVLEVGAGLGLAGLVAACHARTVHLSDFNPLVLDAIRHNISINSARRDLPPDVALNCGRTHALHLDWDTLPDHTISAAAAADADAAAGGSHKVYDVIIGTDVICQESDAAGVVRVLRRHLAPRGVAHLVLPSQHARYGVEVLPARLGEAGLKWERHTVGPELLEGIEESAYLKWHQYRITR